ncbi:MAG: hypothetical protein JNG85_03375, partial [Spirochaetaceae bacterium]|nr:hypothetical protein [Spirochaetaceae bacterium]
MKKMLGLLAVVFALAGCPNPDTPGVARPLAGLSSSASSYYVEGSASARSMARAGEAAPSGALMQIKTDGTTGAVTFYDEAGAPAAVTTRNARTLSDGRLVLAITYAGADSCVIATPSTG